MTKIERLEIENEKLRRCIRTLLMEPLNSPKLNSPKYKDTEPMSATFLKGQVLEALSISCD